MALHIGSDVFLSQTTVVSLWLVIPIAAISDASAPILFIASTATPSCVDHISSASCSTHPGLGKYCVNSFAACDTICPFSLKMMHLFEVVPASNAIIYFDMFSFHQTFYMSELSKNNLLLYFSSENSKIIPSIPHEMTSPIPTVSMK